MVMTMWARIESGVVAEITDIDPAGRFHKSIQWVECKSSVCVGMLYSGGKFTEQKTEATSLTLEQIVAMRRIAYADPVSGSDGLWIEAQAKRATGDDEGAKEAEQKWLERRAKIAEEHPWP